MADLIWTSYVSTDLTAKIYLLYTFNQICSVMVSVRISNVGQTKDYKIGVYCFPLSMLF
jgi:hypothetical protein